MPPLSVPFIPARWHGGAQSPKAVVIHGTVSPCVGGGARDVARFFANHSQPTSAHYVVDPGETIQCVGDHVIAYHCGYNKGSIAFELCDPQAGPASRWSDANHRKMLDLAARDVAQTCMEYGIAIRRPTIGELKAQGPHGIYGHNDSRLAFGHTTHSDPGPDFPWADFIAAVSKYAGGTTPPRQDPKMTPALRFRALLLVACQFAKAEIPPSRKFVHTGRLMVEKFARGIK